MCGLVQHTVKINRELYKVEVFIWDEYHCAISYDPIPETTSIRAEIDDKLARWVPHRRKELISPHP